jgi:S-adenosyl methyltransferase
VEKAYNTLAPIPVTARSQAEITGLFAGLELIPPGVVAISEWRPGASGPSRPPADLHGGVGCKPR